MRRVLLLGASGSIGTQTLDILAKERENFALLGFSIGHQIDKIPAILALFPSVKAVGLLDNPKAEALRKAYPEVTFFVGEKASVDLVNYLDCDMVVNAIVGFAGLLPSLASLEKNRILCLANKESLVVGGSFIKEHLKEGKGTLYPIDSEHVALAKCLSLVQPEEVDHLFLTGSGGSFRNKRREELVDVTPEMALRHPTWHMGSRITIDCATMMNKGFEMIEAKELFDYPLEKITIVLHDESIVHSGIVLKNGTILAEVCPPDMHGPISYALHEGKDHSNVLRLSSLSELKDLHFHPFDPERYPAVALARKAASMPLGATCVLNAADEVAVSRFLKGEISFLRIEEIVQMALSRFKGPICEEGDLISLDEMTRVYAHTC